MGFMPVIVIQRNEMKEKCPFYGNGTCMNKDKCEWEIWHFQKKECRKGGLLKTPKKLEAKEE